MYIELDDEWIIVPHDAPFEVDSHWIYKRIVLIIESSDFKQTMAWNEPENQDRKLRHHRNYTLNERNPDDDFIDLGALTRNISQSMLFHGDLAAKKLRQDIIKEWQDKQVGTMYDRLHFEP